MYAIESPFAGMLNQLLDVCELRDRKRTEAIFLAATYTRNSLHNNGMHRGPNLEIELQDMCFKLETDRVGQSGSFAHVLAVLFEMMGCLEEMLPCPTLAKHVDPIPDDWILDAAPNPS
jgi:hypothetical protein